MTWAEDNLQACSLLFACMVGVLGLQADSSEPMHEKKSLVALASKHLGLEYPYSIERLEKYADGGSYGGLIRDVSGRDLLFAWDGRERSSQVAEESPRPAYVGCDYPGGSGGKRLGIGTSEEQALIFVLRSFVDGQIAPSHQDSLYPIFFDSSSTWKARSKRLGPLTAKQDIALKALWIARYLERQSSSEGLKNWPWPKAP